MTTAPDEEVCSSTPRFRWVSSVSGWLQAGVALPIGVLAGVVGIELLSAQAPPLLLAWIPGVVFLVLWFGLRPVRRLPIDLRPEDWGETLGFSWVRVASDTWFVPHALKRELTLQAAEPQPHATLEGFDMSLRRHRPEVPGVVLACTTTLLTLLPVCSFYASRLAWAESRGLSLEMLSFVVLTTTVSALVLSVLLAPWVALVAVFGAVWRRHRSGGLVALRGRVLRTDRGQITLGHPTQELIEQQGSLVVRNDHEQLEIRAQQSDLVALRSHIEAIDLQLDEAPSALLGLQRPDRGTESV